MSRGPGRVQRGVLAVVEYDERDRWWSMAELAAEVYGRTPHRTEIESVRRAVKSLGAHNLLEVEAFDEAVHVGASRVDRGEHFAYRPRHLSTRPMLFAHTPLSVEQKGERGRRLAESLDHLVALDDRIGQ